MKNGPQVASRAWRVSPGRLRNVLLCRVRLRPPTSKARSRMDTIERIVRIEVLLPTLVTKEDLAREFGVMREDMLQRFAGVAASQGALRAEMIERFAGVAEGQAALRAEMIERFAGVADGQGALRAEMIEGFAGVAEGQGALRAEMIERFGAATASQNTLRMELEALRAEVNRRFDEIASNDALFRAEINSRFREASADFRAEMQREIALQTVRFVQWVTGVFVAVSSALVAATYFIATHH